MGRYSLGKNVGTTDKATSQRSLPVAGEGLTFDASPNNIKKISKPDVVIQKWSGSTFISNPSPTLVPQLQLPSVEGVLAQPNRDFEQLSRALSGLNTNLGQFAGTYYKNEKKFMQASRRDAEQIIGRTALQGTAPNKVASLQTELERIANDPNSSTEDKKYATATINRIRNESRLKDAIASAYREQTVLSQAASLDALSPTAVITETDPNTKEEIQVPINTLSPDDPRYTNWVNSIVYKGTERLSPFEYNNIKGTLAQYIANNRTKQSSLYNTHQTNEYERAFNRDTALIGEELASDTISPEQATFKLQGLLDRGRIGGITEAKRKELNENLVENVLVAWRKANPNGNPEDLEPIFAGLTIGPTESRVLTTKRTITITSKEEADLYNKKIGDQHEIIETSINPKQQWLNGFPAGWFEGRIYDANSKMKVQDDNAKKRINGEEMTNATAYFRENIIKDLDEIADLPILISRIRQQRTKALEGITDPLRIDAINKAYDSIENSMYGVFASDYRTDVENLNKSALAALRDNSLLPRFKRDHGIFEEKWGGYRPAQDYLQTKVKLWERLLSEKYTSAKTVLNGILKGGQEQYENVYGKAGGSLGDRGGWDNTPEKALWPLIEERIVNDYIAGIDLSWSQAELNKYNKEFIAEYNKDPKAFIFKYRDQVTDITNTNVEKPPEELQSSFPGNINDSVAAFSNSFVVDGKIDAESRIRLGRIYDSDVPLFDRETTIAIADMLFKGDISSNPTLKILLHNLPADDRGKAGNFIKNELGKHNIEIDPNRIEQTNNLNKSKVSFESTQPGSWNISQFLELNQGPLVASTELGGLFGISNPLKSKANSDEFRNEGTLASLIEEMNAPESFRGTSLIKNKRDGDYQSDKNENWFFDFKPELVQPAIERIQTLTDEDLNAMTIGALLEAGPTDKGKFEVAATLLTRSVQANPPWSIARVLTQEGQFEAIFNPQGRVRGTKPYTTEELEGKPNFVKLGLLLDVSPKEARRLYYLQRDRFESQIQNVED